MTHTHGPDGRHEIHGGSHDGVGWQVLDTIVVIVVMALGAILADLAITAWRERRAASVRFNLTPEGEQVLRTEVAAEPDDQE